MKKQATSEEKRHEEMRARLKNSLPWILSRWFRKIFSAKSKKEKYMIAKKRFNRRNLE